MSSDVYVSLSNLLSWQPHTERGLAALHPQHRTAIEEARVTISEHIHEGIRNQLVREFRESLDHLESIRNHEGLGTEHGPTTSDALDAVNDARSALQRLIDHDQQTHS